jgi:disulfide bond formation protein DsbB
MTVWYVATGLAVLIFAWGVYMGGYHAGVEWGFWPGPTDCGGASSGLSFDDLNNIDNTHVVPCNVAAFRFLGISFAGYNALVSLAIVALLVVAMLDQRRRYKA